MLVYKTLRRTFLALLAVGTTAANADESGTTEIERVLQEEESTELLQTLLNKQDAESVFSPDKLMMQQRMP